MPCHRQADTERETPNRAACNALRRGKKRKKVGVYNFYNKKSPFFKGLFLFDNAPLPAFIRSAFQFYSFHRRGEADGVLAKMSRFSHSRANLTNCNSALEKKGIYVQTECDTSLRRGKAVVKFQKSGRRNKIGKEIDVLFFTRRYTVFEI